MGDRGVERFGVLAGEAVGEVDALEGGKVVGAPAREEAERVDADDADASRRRVPEYLVHAVAEHAGVGGAGKVDHVEVVVVVDGVEEGFRGGSVALTPRPLPGGEGARPTPLSPRLRSWGERAGRAALSPRGRGGGGGGAGG